METVTKDKVSKVLFYVSLLAFASFVGYILYINQEVLYTAHDRSEFLYGTAFLDKLLSKPFGLIQYAGAWLTQLFFSPALGAGVLAFIWILIYFVGAKAFRLQGRASALMLLPVACLLTSVVDMGYWIYVYTIRGYWFSQSLGYLAMMLLLWAARYTPRKWHLVWYLLAVCAYPVLGWFALLFAICLGLSEKPSWRELLGCVLLVFTAGIWHGLMYSNLKFDDVVLAGFPRFITASDCTQRLSIPFWLLGAISIFIPLCRKFLDKWFVPAICAVVGIAFTSSFMYYDKNYIDEMRLVRYAESDNWKEVLRGVEGNPTPTTTMIMLKNVALMNEGGLLDYSFKMGNSPTPINNPDTLHVTFLDTASPLVYYNYGMINESIRLCYENGIQAGFTPFYLKMLSRCALAKGDGKLVERFNTILHHHPFYRDWQPAKVSRIVNILKKSYSDELTGVENSDSYLVNSISLWYEANNKVASEQALFYSMLRCDSRRFWPSLRKYIEMHKGEKFPVHAQEAYILYMDKAPEKKRIMIPVEQSVYNRYKQFWSTLEGIAKPGMQMEDISSQMSKAWSDTYWYYNIFGSKIL